MRRLESTKRSQRTGHPEAGFSLIELLVVVAVILAVQSLRNIATAELVYSTTYGINFTDNLLKLSGSGINPDQNSAGLIDEVLASGIKQGYVITYTPLTTDAQGHTATFSVTADPISSTTGQRHFYADQSCVIRQNLSVQAGPSDIPL